MVFAKGYEQSLFPFRDSEGKEKQASERKIDCGSTGALAFKDVGNFRPRSLVNRPSLWRPPVYKMGTVLS